MTHIAREQLYPFIYELKQFDKPGESLGVELPEDLIKTIKRADKAQFQQAPAVEHRLKMSQLKAFVEHIKDCEECQVLVYEDGMGAKRAKGAEDLQREEDEEQLRIKAMKQQFFVNLGYSLPCVVAARFTMGKYYQKTRKDMVKGPTLKAQHQAKLAIDPLLLVAGLLIFIGAWGLAECWRIANEVWFDWTKAKEAVPFIGKAWAERSRKAKEEEEQQRKKGKK